MKFSTACALILFIVILGSCASVKNNPKYQLTDGYYKSKLSNTKHRIVYVDNNGDTISVYQADRKTKSIDMFTSRKKVFPKQTVKDIYTSTAFKQASFDIDFLTIPFKYRPAQKDFPRQFNTNLNGAIYLGYRNDVYHLNYKKTPLHQFQRQVEHYGYSFGFITGLGGTTMNPSVTAGQIKSEYDGVVWSKGVAGIFGLNNITVGLAVGYDDLLDKNKQYWIYQRKPWIGLAFGLNIN